MISTSVMLLLDVSAFNPTSWGWNYTLFIKFAPKIDNKK